MATVSPGRTRARLTAAPQPVGTAQPTKQARSSGRSGSILITESTSQTVYSLKAETSANCAMSCPSLWKRKVPSSWAPCVRRIPRSQSAASPLRHQRHLPQAGMEQSTTWSSGWTSLTPGPTFSTMPAPSCPTTMGKRTGASPLAKCQSERHSPVATSLSSTSPSFGSSTSISSMENERVGPYKTAARDFIEHPLYFDLVINLY